ncbi:T3SS effector HopA1 family protein [Nonomuraea sp. NPDC055795]
MRHSVLIALDRLVNLVEIADDHGVRVAGEQCDLAAADACERVADALYTGWYLPPFGVDPPSRIGDLTALLRAAHAGAERFEGGWLVTAAAPDGRCVVSREGRSRAVQPGEYVLPLRPAVPPAPGDLLDVVRRHDWTDQDSGFWCARSPDQPEPPINRAYLNLPAGAAAPVLHAVTARLEREGLPHSLKCPSAADGYARVDSLVIYYEREREEQAHTALQEVHMDIGSLLRPAVPPLSLRLAPGLAHAEQPAGGESFGQSRCRVLATALVAALRADTDRKDLRATLLNGLSAAGIALHRPWAAA